MYLTRAFLDPKSQAVRVDLRNPEDLHKTVMRAFPDDAGPSPRESYGVLHRLDQEHDGRTVLLVQSRTKPMVERWPPGYVVDLASDLDLAFSTVGENPAIRSVGAERDALAAGDRFMFRLRANTTKKIDTKTGPDGVRRNGRRVPVRGEQGRVDWLSRHAQAAGFEIEQDALRMTEIAPMGGRGAKAITLAGALFEGVLVVRESERFRAALENGIGPAKAYGFGLLSVRRLP